MNCLSAEPLGTAVIEGKTAVATGKLPFVVLPHENYRTSLGPQ
jgi:hypothetical protein